MAVDTTVPIHIAPDASERVAELGLQVEFDRFLEYAQHSIPGVLRIEVEAPPRYDLGGDPVVHVEAFVPEEVSDEEYSARHWDAIRWQVTSFPPEVNVNLSLCVSR